MKAWILFCCTYLFAGCSHPPKEHHAHGLRHDFSEAERWAKEFDDPAREEWQKPAELVVLMRIRPGQSVADIGAGTGYFLPYLNRAVGERGEVLALDVESSLVDHMRKRIERQKLASTKARLIRHSDPGLGEGSVDRVLIVNTWHHIGNRATYSRLLRKALRSGGSVWVVDFAPDAEGPGPKRKHRLSAAAVEAELREAGFSTRIEQSSLPYQYVVVGTL